LHLSPEDIAAAEVCGISFLPATAAQVQRLAMQRKVFYRAGEPILATRGDGFYETVGTLQQLIEEGRQQQRDLATWLQAATPATGPQPLKSDTAAVEPVVSNLVMPPEIPAVARTDEALSSLPSQEEPSAAPVTEAFQSLDEQQVTLPVPAVREAPPKRQRQSRYRLEPTKPWTGTAAQQERAAEQYDADSAVPMPLGSVPSRSPAPPVLLTSEAANGTTEPPQQRGGRWLVAGAARRGRAGKHWSTRQR
jgi:hypothetical protein